MAPVVMDRWLLLILISLALRTPEILNFVYPPLSFYQSNRVQKNSTENVISFRQATRLILLFQVIRFAVPCFFLTSQGKISRWQPLKLMNCFSNDNALWLLLVNTADVSTLFQK